MSSYSVTEARNALRCPRVFALGRARRQQVAFPMGSSTLGATFHRLVDLFAQHAPNAPAAVRGAQTPEAASEAVSAWVLGFLEHELEINEALHGMPAEVDDLAEALRRLAKYVVTRSAAAGRSTADSIATFLAHAELAIDVAAKLPGDREVKLVGRIDAVHVPPEGPIEVVEYKLTDEANEEIDRAQVALYRYLLRMARGVDATPVLLRFNPALAVTRVPAADADALVEKKLLPLLASMIDWATDPASAPPPTRTDLCPACPLRKPCIETYPSALAARDDPPSGAARPRPAPDGALAPTPATAPPLTEPLEHPPAIRDEAGVREAAQFRKWILDILKSQQVPSPIAKPPTVGARLIQVEVSVKKGRVAWIDKAKEDVIHRLASEHQLAAQYEKRGGLRLFTIGRNEPRRVELPPMLAARSAWMAERPGRFVLGETIDGSILTGDLGEPASCHLLVGGATGSGKSVLLRAIAASLAHYHGPDAIRFTLVDPKRVTFTKLAASLAAHLAGPVCYDVEETQPVLDALVEEMEERYRAFEDARAQDIDEHNAMRPGDALARHVVIVDEFQDLAVSKVTREPFLASIRRLGAKARAAGIHLVLATQRPTRENVPGSVKANLPGKVALKTASALESRIIVDTGGAEALLGHGDFLADLGRGVVRGQAPIA